MIVNYVYKGDGLLLMFFSFWFLGERALKDKIIHIESNYNVIYFTFKVTPMNLTIFFTYKNLKFTFYFKSIENRKITLKSKQ